MFFVSISGYVGKRSLDYASEILQSLAIFGSVFRLAIQPRHWPRTVRAVFARQLLFGGIGAVPHVSTTAALTGILLVVQAQLWLGRIGMTQISGPLLVAVIVRELGPLLANLVVIVNSGSAISTELGLMKVRGEVGALQAMGIEPLPYLIMPRVLATGISSLCLTLLLIAVSFATGFLVEALLGSVRTDFFLFVNNLLQALRPEDIITVVIKGLVPGLFTGVICSACGLNAGPSVSSVPTACRRGLLRSVAALFVITAASSILIYL